jgi:hypothetical protein
LLGILLFASLLVGRLSIRWREQLFEVAHVVIFAVSQLASLITGNRNGSGRNATGH